MRDTPLGLCPFVSEDRANLRCVGLASLDRLHHAVDTTLTHVTEKRKAEDFGTDPIGAGKLPAQAG